MTAMGGKWIWYPGDFEIHHGLLQNMAREERGFSWPAYWYMDDCRRNVHFRKKYTIEEPARLLAHGIGQGYVAVNNRKYPLDQTILCEKGENVIDIFIGNVTGLPCVIVQGDVIFSDESWMADTMAGDAPVPAGVCRGYDDPGQDPNVVYFQKEEIPPVSVTETGGGVLFDFHKEISGRVRFEAEKCSASAFPVKLCFGESETEALDTDRCYYSQDQAGPDTPQRKRAFRYVFIPARRKNEISINAVHEFLHAPVRGSFMSSDAELNQIWRVAEDTFLTCCGLLIPEGAKRDRWLWSGDAYQSYFINQYLQADAPLNQRMIVAMRGLDPIRQHINTIVDYSLLWIISIRNQYMMDGDTGFLSFIFPKMKTMLDYCLAQTDENGFIVERPGDWIFVDWAEMDKTGPVAAEQMFLLEALQSFLYCAGALGCDAEEYGNRAEKLRANINAHYWDAAEGAYIDSFVSGKRNVTRHANILAILFCVADDAQVSAIRRNVLFNEKVPPITTPYFKFFELDALGQLGDVQDICRSLHDYWGGMLRQGAVAFWEEFDPEKKGAAQYEMYGDPYGKSLCHAWGASPVYLIGRYLCGVYPTEAGYRKYVVDPRGTDVLETFEATVPAGQGDVHLAWKNGVLRVRADADGGTLRWKNTQIALPAGETIAVPFCASTCAVV